MSALDRSRATVVDDPSRRDVGGVGIDIYHVLLGTMVLMTHLPV